MDKRAKRLAASALFAGVAGYVAGILTAPKSGKETRKDLHRAALKAKTEAEKQLKALHSELAVTIETGKRQAGKLKSKARTELDAALQKATKAKEKSRILLSAVREGQAEDEDLQKAINEAKRAIKNLKKYLKKNDK